MPVTSHMTDPTPTAQSKSEHTAAISHTDLHCIACGYNLRGLPVDGRCPECSAEIRLSRFEFLRPGVMSLGFALTGVSFLLLPVYPVSVILRLIGLFHLRYKARPDHLPAFRRWIPLMWLIACVELIFAPAFTVLWIVQQFVPREPLEHWWLAVLLPAGMCVAIIAWLGGRLGTALADLIYPSQIKTGVYVQQLGILITAACAIPLVLTVALSVLERTLVILKASFVVAGGFTALFSAFILVDLAMAISKSSRPARSDSRCSTNNMTE